MSVENTETKQKPMLTKRQEGIRKRMQNLKQYRDKPDDAVISAADIVVPEVVPAPEKPVDAIPVYMRDVLSASEYRLYAKEVAEWMTAYPDKRSKEAIDDINSIAMEKVIQMRLHLSRKRNAKLNIDKEYTASVSRVQSIRKTLGCHKGAGDSVSSLAGAIDLADRRRRIEEERRADSEEENMSFPRLT